MKITTIIDINLNNYENRDVIGSKESIKKKKSLYKTWQCPTLPCLKTKYHRR